jgi:pilus assembly protein CpaC
MCAVCQKVVGRGKDEMNTPRNIVTLGISIALMLNTGFAVHAASVENMDLFVGEIAILESPVPSRVAIGDGSKIKVELLEKEKQILIIGEQPGSTSFRLWTTEGQKNFNIRISEKDPETRVRLETMVEFSVQIMEFRKSALKKIGIDWDDSTSGPTFALAFDGPNTPILNSNNLGSIPGLPTSLSGMHAFFGMSAQLNSRINLVAAAGDATTLAEPRLSTRNGGTASFLAGGEVPFPVTNANGATNVEFKQYGVKLDISPQVSPDGLIVARINTEISQIDPSVSVNNAPGFITRSTQTDINLRAGETMVISGLMNSEVSEDADKIPWLGDIPFLGSLFSSDSYRDNKSELVIFVTPALKNPELQAREQQHQDNWQKTRSDMIESIGKGVID